MGEFKEAERGRSLDQTHQTHVVQGMSPKLSKLFQVMIQIDK